MIFRGNVSELIEVAKNVIQVVIIQNKNGKFNHLCFVAFGNIYNDVKSLNLDKKDKVKIECHLSCKKNDEKYYTSAVVDSIKIVKRRPLEFDL